MSKPFFGLMTLVWLLRTASSFHVSADIDMLGPAWCSEKDEKVAASDEEVYTNRFIVSSLAALIRRLRFVLITPVIKPGVLPRMVATWATPDIPVVVD